MSLDGWSLDRKINKVRDEIDSEIRELKMNFALLYDYIRNMEKDLSSSKKKKVTKKDKN